MVKSFTNVFFPCFELENKSFLLQQLLIKRKILHNSLRLFRFDSRPTGFGIEFDVPAVKKSARNALAGARTERCAQSRKGFAAT